MATQVQWRGGSTSEHSTFTGAAREVTVDTQKKTLVVHDGSTAGGEPLLREDGSNSAFNLGTAATPALKFAGDTNTGIYSPGADQVAISTNGTGKLFINATGEILLGDATDTNTYIHHPAADTIGIITGGAGAYFKSGSLGLGTSNPGTLLTLSEDQGTTITLRRNNSVAVLDDLIGKIDFFSNDGSSPGARVTATVGAYAQSTAGGTYLAFSTATNGGSNAERLRIDQAGNVGIGTTSPVSRLHASQGGDSNVITYVQGATKGLRIGTNTTGALLEGVDGTNGATSYEPLLVGGSEVRFTTSAIERARIDSSGRLLVGTSSALTTRLLTTTLTPSFQVKEGGGGSALFFCGINGAAPATVFAAKSRGTSYGTIVQNNDGLLRISAAGDDGVQATEAARIEAFVDGTPGANDMPGRLVFSTTADGASSPTERMRITSAGQLLVGATSARSVGAVAPLSAKVQIETTEYYGFSVVNNTNDSSPSVITLGKSRGTSTGSSTVVQSGDELGIIGFAGADGTDLETLAAAISADVDGTPGANDMPGRLVFSVTADGASSPTEAMRIKNTRVINFSNAPVYADNAAAKAGGLVDGDVYRTSTGDLKIVYT